MADAQSPVSNVVTPSTIPMKRQFEDEHAPAVSSPLNPDAAARSRLPKLSVSASATSSTPTREPREKKDSLKKRESVGLVSALSTGPASADSPKKKKQATFADPPAGLPSPIRYNHRLPTELFHYTIKPPVFSSHEPEPFYAPDGRELKKPTDHPENKKIYRYTHCVADPSFAASRYYRASDGLPYGPRMSFEDSDKWFHFNESGTMVTNEKGWRMGRANVCAREGRFYYEVKIVKGVPREGEEGSQARTDDKAVPRAMPHIRMGWARREAPLDAPVGFDGYSYGLTDIRMEPMHRSRAHKFLDDGGSSAEGKATNAKRAGKAAKSKSKAKEGPKTDFAADDHAREGDVIGMEISLPSISFHRKVVDGIYNPAVDTDAGLDEPGIEEGEGAPNIVRDRCHFAWKGNMYFESMEYRSSKGMDGYGDRGPFAKETPSPNHADPTLRSLPHSSIKVWKNGKRVGTAFKNLMAFLPPASAPGAEKGVRQGCDDGMVGYFPAIGVFSGGIAEVNFGPEFWYPPSELHTRPANATDVQVKQEDEDTVIQDATDDTEELRDKLRGIGDRYAEQIAEDVLYDIIDEVDFFVQDGGSMETIE